MIKALVLVGAALFSMAAVAADGGKPNCPALLDQQFPRLQDEKPQSLCQYAGKVLLVVNTASYCGYTNQYDGLERLHQKYGDRGLVVIGFPSNNFNQEPGANSEIAEFCRTTYGVKFPMFARSDVAGRNQTPFFQRLTSMSGQAPQWNFHKYLVDRNGTKVTSFPTQVSPESPLLVSAIERLLDTRP